ncbi:hypothetical protein PPYR_15259 [Photinus pyralis]|uniref:PDZ domain-containing protein n=1 Tax=Photinus pyralis TaxID=7054 RepID=A0A5N3ZZ76_PHOPY|nr:hypothetical protein PPYR_15259 [Photinus pyralis]
MGVIKKLLLIISRPARLLECLEFDPEEFYHFLEAAEDHVKCLQGIKADLPQYIIQKLGLNRDPIAELQQELRDCNLPSINPTSQLYDTDDSPVFGLFSSCSPQYRKVQGSRLGTSIDQEQSSEAVRITTSVATTPDTPEIPDFRMRLRCGLLTPDKDYSDILPLDHRKISLDLNKTVSTPESSQTDSDDVSPQIQRKRKSGHARDILPRFSISVEDEHSSIETGTSSSENNRELSPVSRNQPPVAPPNKHRSRSVVKSASASGLSLMIPANDDFQTPTPGIHSPGGGGGSSTASSRDTSPCRELSPLVTSLKPPVIIRRGPKGFGFTVHTIRVYYGDTDFYTMHHLVMAVDEGSPAFEAGLRPADLITHVNGEAVQGLYHTQVLQLLLSGVEHVSLRATPLEHTSIQSGGRKREPGQSKLARRSLHRQRKQKRENDKRRKTSLFRRISNKRASAEIQQMAAGVQSPLSVTPSRSFQSFTRNPDSSSSLSQTSIRTSVSNRTSLSPSDSFSQHSSSSSSQSSSSASPSPTQITNNRNNKQHYQRPSTLHGLKHKLHSTGCTKTLHSASPSCPNVPNRRKSVGHIPLSPLARTPSPSPLPASPTRSPSPLAFPIGHQPGSSNTTQSYSPSAGNTPITMASNQAKKGFVRPKAAEPGSPLLRRALSPDRLHPRSAESKCALISPLCSSSKSPVVKTQTRGGSSAVWRSASQPERDKDAELESSVPSSNEIVSSSNSASENRLSLNLSSTSEPLPRIAEEKDSPTNSAQECNKSGQLNDKSCVNPKGSDGNTECLKGKSLGAKDNKCGSKLPQK